MLNRQDVPDSTEVLKKIESFEDYCHGLFDAFTNPSVDEKTARLLHVTVRGIQCLQVLSERTEGEAAGSERFVLLDMMAKAASYSRAVICLSKSGYPAEAAGADSNA